MFSDYYCLVLTGLGDKLTDEEFAKLRAFMDITPSGQISYERKLLNAIFHFTLL